MNLTGKKTLITINPDNKRFKEAREINQISKDSERARNEFILFSLALFYGLVINLFSTYLDEIVKTNFPKYYNNLKLLIFIFFLSYIVLFIYILKNYSKKRRDYEKQFIEISRQNPLLKTYKMNETVQTEDWKIKIIKLYNKRKLKTDISQYSPIGNYLLLELFATNLQSETTKFPLLYFRLLDDKGNKYNYDTVTYRIDRNVDKELIPGKKYKLIIVYKTPRNIITNSINFEHQYVSILLNQNHS